MSIRVQISGKFYTFEILPGPECPTCESREGYFLFGGYPRCIYCHCTNVGAAGRLIKRPKHETR